MSSGPPANLVTTEQSKAEAEPVSRDSAKTAFWESAKILKQYKPRISLAMLGALISAGCFGAGLGMLLPVFDLLLASKKSLADVIQEHLMDPSGPVWLQDIGQRLLDIVPTDPFTGFTWVMVVIIVLTIIGSMGRFLHEALAISVALHASMVYRGRMFRRLVTASFATTLQHNTSDNISRLLVDTRNMANGYRVLLGRATEAVLKGIFCIAIAIAVNPIMTLVALVGMPILIVMFRKFGKRIRRATHAALQQQGKMVGRVSESLGAINVVKVHNAEGSERRRFWRVNRSVYDEEMKVRQIHAFASPVVDTFSLVSIALVMILAAWAIYNRGQNPAEFMTILALLLGAGDSLKPLSNLYNEIQESGSAAVRVLDVLNREVETEASQASQASESSKLSRSSSSQSSQPAKSLVHLPRHQRDVVFENVTVNYPNSDKPAVEQVNLSITHGQAIALVGPNGSGKTTLLSTLPRLLMPTSGRVLIDGIDIANVGLRPLREQIGMVTQQSILFEGTIADNIAYGRRHESRERIVAAARAAYADEFVATLPKGYDTVLGENGAGLSGGQKQRLCIARAILRDPAILILDEATSQIDSDSESKITTALHEIRHGRTMLVIAHRLSTVIDSDLIVVMEDGHIIDQGKHDDLLSRCATYRSLVNTQLIAGEPENT